MSTCGEGRGERGEGKGEGKGEGEGKGSANVMSVSRSCNANVYGRQTAWLTSWPERSERCEREKVKENHEPDM